MNDFLKRDDEFRYQLLNRLQEDCKYYLGCGNRCKKYLWSGNEKDHIQDMKKLYNSFNFDKKPEWLTWHDILEYERKMLNA